ncbi:hypothetical protein FG379_002198 [Cryptosporidium bovis]|uniref:uncharacterized protein n=1 Tax=Cryptosporidium bovis TaxID=310047 RepID=UPI00351A5A48|nr:hypothetical protein FG379_002198 [Cryptosporidium bovis]
MDKDISNYNEYNAELNDLDLQMEEMLNNIENEKSSDILSGKKRDKIVSEDSFVKFDTRKMIHFNIEDVTFSNTTKRYNIEKIKYHRIVKSGIKYAEYSLRLANKQKETIFSLSEFNRKRKKYQNSERFTASSSIIASVTMLKSILYREIPTNTKWAYMIFLPLILSNYFEVYNNMKKNSKLPKGIFGKAMLRRKNEALQRLNKSLLGLTRHVNKLNRDGTCDYNIKATLFWKFIEPLIITPAHGSITTDIIKKPKNASSEYLKEVISILRSKKYKLAVDQSKSKDDFYYYVKHDLEF